MAMELQEVARELEMATKAIKVGVAELEVRSAMQ